MIGIDFIYQTTWESGEYNVQTRNDSGVIFEVIQDKYNTDEAFKLIKVGLGKFDGGRCSFRLVSIRHADQMIRGAPYHGTGKGVRYWFR